MYSNVNRSIHQRLFISTGGVATEIARSGAGTDDGRLFGSGRRRRRRQRTEKRDEKTCGNVSSTGRRRSEIAATPSRQAKEGRQLGMKIVDIPCD